jgi:transcription antitermination factor NusG
LKISTKNKLTNSFLNKYYRTTTNRVSKQLQSYENHLSESDPKWFAVRTRFKSEKVALKQLERLGVETYLPIRQMTRRYGRKIRKVELPLINSFVFVRVKKSEYASVLETEYVAGFLKFGNNLLSIPDTEIDMIRRLLGEDVELEVVAKEDAYEKGDWVEVTKGPLLGMKGCLLTIQGKDKLLIDLSNSGHSFHITIDTDLLKKINANMSIEY